MNYLQYILIVSLCLGFFYVAYAVIFRNDINFRHARVYLIASVILSLFIPLSEYKINTGVKWHVQNKETASLYVTTAAVSDTPLTYRNYGLWEKIRNYGPLSLIITLYLVISALFLLRILIKLILLAHRYRISYKVHLTDCVLLYNHGFRNTLSFFRWIFIQPEIGNEEDLEQIIAHEKIHVNQLHSFDILLIELLTAVMWFNPFIWMIRNSMQLIHEYLADDGALKTGINPFRYQALLINQIAEERILILSSSFNNSLIKKRIKMITKSKNQGKPLLNLLAIIPVAILIFILTSAFNGVFSEEAATGNATFSLVSTNQVYPDNIVNPPDTIIKKTIIKKISSENPNDTIVTEKEEIITGDDAIYEVETLRHGGKGKHVIVIDDDDNISHVRDGERREVRVHVTAGRDTLHEVHGERHSESKYEVHVINSDATVEEIEIGDSVKHVKVIRRDNGKEVSKDKKVIIRHSDGREDSDILYIIDGKEFTGEEALKNIDPDQIESISVYKDENVSKYTARDYEGVIVIITKKGKKK